jgi:hypothetical protein
MEILNDFSEIKKNGFRLHNLEGLNWGTFQGKWNFNPKEETTLLTGESGSGKSTLVDALTTILVAPYKIKFNQAADVDSKERTILSYVRGYYGQKSNAEGKGNIEALRDYNSYSVILANFYEQTLKQEIGLAVVFYFKEANSVPSKFYIVSEKFLSIDNDFIFRFNDIKILRDSLKQKSYSVFNDYSQYFNYFSKRLGNLTEQSIQLFQKTISMKKMGELSDFIRKNMLEKLDIEVSIEKLIQHYNDLNRAYEATVKARKQLEMLNPISEKGKIYLSEREEKSKFQSAINRLDIWLAKKKDKLYEEKISDLIEQKKEKEISHDSEDKKFKECRKELENLRLEILQNGGDKLQEYKIKLKHEEENFKQKEKRVNDYFSFAKNINLNIPNRVEEFNNNRKILEKIAKENGELIKKTNKIRDEKVIENSKIAEERKNIEAELISLRERTSNIPLKYVELKEKIQRALNLEETDISFVGELIEVKSEEKDWEGAIERFLHSFSLTLLIKKEDYAKVAEYVNKNFLNLKLVYYYVDVKKTKYELSYIETFSVLNKIDIKVDSIFSAWIKKQLYDRYNYICCDSLEDFRVNKKALTKTGQIKSDSRHEKDDRADINDRRNYIMGFSNKNKIKILESYLQEKENLLKNLSCDLDKLDEELKRINNIKNSIDSLERFKDFEDLDILTSKNKIEELNEIIEKLKKDNNILKDLESRVASLAKEEVKLENKVKNLLSSIIELEKDLSYINKEYQKNKFISEEDPHSLYLDDYDFLKKHSQFWNDFPLTLENINSFQNKYSLYLNRKILDLEEKLKLLEKNIESLMREFKREYPIESQDFDDNVEALKEYNAFLEKILKDELPKYEEKFKKELQENIFRHIIHFKTNLDIQERTIKDKIKEINDSLEGIDYSKGRYIKLIQKRTVDKDIIDFRNSLNHITTNSIDDNNLIEEKFLEIKKIIDRFKGRANETDRDKKWTAYVTDVRNWFHFSATEYWRDNNEEYEHYTDSGGKSGGQKEKLAYTILGASLAYNYGINTKNRTSFRLIIIDEAFLKSSDESARFGLELFKKLDFQFIIVTPLLKINTMEPYIRHVGFVSYNDNSHISTLTNISLSEYIEMKEKIQGRKLEWDGLTLKK